MSKKRCRLSMPLFVMNVPMMVVVVETVGHEKPKITWINYFGSSLSKPPTNHTRPRIPYCWDLPPPQLLTWCLYRFKIKRKHFSYDKFLSLLTTFALHFSWRYSKPFADKVVGIFLITKLIFCLFFRIEIHSLCFYLKSWIKTSSSNNICEIILKRTLHIFIIIIKSC